MSTVWLCDLPNDKRLRPFGPYSISSLYAAMQGEGLIDVFFYGHRHFTYADFVDWIDADENWVYIAYDADIQSPQAFAVLNGHTGKCSLMHFCVFREARSIALPISKEFLSIVGKERTVLLGLTPKPYRSAYQHALSCGFQHIDTIPNACYFARIDKYFPGHLTKIVF